MEQDQFQIFLSKEDYNQLKEWKVKFANLEQDKKKEAQRYDDKLQNYIGDIQQLKSDLQSTKRQIYQFTRSQIDAIDRILNQLNSKKIEGLAQCLQKLSLSSKQIRSNTNMSIIQVTPISQQILSLIKMLSQQISKLEKLNKQFNVQKTNLIQNYQTKVKSLKQDLTIVSQENSDKDQQIRVKTQKLMLFEKGQSALNNELNALKQNKKTLQISNKQLGNQNSQARQHLVQLKSLLEAQKEKQYKIKSELQNQLRKNQNLSHQQVKILQKIKNEQLKNKQLVSQLINSQNIISNLKTREIQLKQSYKIIDSAKQELKKLKQVYENQTKLFKQSQSKSKGYLDSIKANQEREKASQEREKAHLTITLKYQSQVKELSLKLNEVQKKISDRSKMQQIAQAQKKQLMVKQDKYNQLIKQNLRQIDMLKVQNQALRNKFSQKQKQYLNNQDLQAIKMQQKHCHLQQKTKQVQLLIQTMDMLKKKLNEADYNSTNLKQQCNKLVKERQDMIQKYRAESNFLQNNITVLESYKAQNQQTIKTLSSKNNKLVDKIQCLQEQLTLFQNTNLKGNQRIQNLVAQLKIIQQKNNNTDINSNKSNQLIQQLREQFNIAKDDNKAMKQYIDCLEKENQEFKVQSNQNKKQLASYQDFIAQNNQNFNKIMKINNQLQEVNANLNEELQLVKQKTQKMQKSKIRQAQSKGAKSYFVKQIITEYGHQMKKNLLEIGALSHQEIKQLIVSQLRQIQNFVKSLQQNYD